MDSVRIDHTKLHEANTLNFESSHTFNLYSHSYCVKKLKLNNTRGTIESMTWFDPFNQESDTDRIQRDQSDLELQFDFYRTSGLITIEPLIWFLLNHWFDLSECDRYQILSKTRPLTNVIKQKVQSMRLNSIALEKQSRLVMRLFDTFVTVLIAFRGQIDFILLRGSDKDRIEYDPY